jgi:hypothetical protein
MIQVIGYKEILAKIVRLPTILTDPYLTKLHRKASVPVVNEIHLRTPVGKTGNLADSIGTVKVRGAGLGAVASGPRRQGGYKGFAGHLIEYGTKRRVTRKGANRGITPKKPFLAPAWGAKQDEVERIIATQLSRDFGQILR